MSFPSPHLPARRLIVVAVTTALGGCANPIVRLDAAGHSLQYSPGVGHEPASMAEAVQKLNHFRATYYESIREQTGTAQGAVTGLVWLGAVALGAATRVHADVLVTAGVVGGTTYGLTVAQLDKRRIDVWNAGIQALDCARKAAIPLEMEDAERQLLETLLRTLLQRRSGVETARAKVAAHVGQIDVTVEASQAITDLLSAVDDALKQSTKTLQAGNELLRASRGSQLSATVNRISSRVTDVMGNVALPPSAVKDILARLPKDIELLVPGAMVKPAPAADPSVAKSQSAVGVETDMDGLKQALLALGSAQEDANNSIRTVDLVKASAALDDCNLAVVIKPLQFEPDALTLTQGVARDTAFQIKGGIPPYRVQVLGSLPQGLSTSFQGDDATTVGVSVTDKVQPVEARLLISDKSNPPLTQQIVIKVQASVPSPPRLAAAPALPVKNVKKTPVSLPPPVPAPAPASNPAATEAAWKELQGALLSPGFSRSLRGVVVGIEAAQLKAGRLFIKLKCSKPDAGLSVTEVREELTAAAPAAKATLISNDALDPQLSQIDLRRSVPCIKE